MTAHIPADDSSSYVNPAGVLILSEHDEDSLLGVDDPYVRFMLLNKVEHNQKACRDKGG